jgi:excisionase family DNA binding protein
VLAGICRQPTEKGYVMNNTPKISETERARRARQRAMSISEFSERYGPGRTTVYEEIKLGRLRARKCGKRTFITEADAERWLQALPLVACDATKTREARGR